MEVGESALCRLAPLGVVWREDEGAAWSERELESLRLLQPAHLRIDLRLSDARQDRAAVLRRAVASARALKSSLEIALTVEREEELEALARSCAQVLGPLPIASWLLLAPDLGAVGPDLVRIAREKLTRFDALALFGSGSNANFAELNRSRPLPGALADLDFVCFASNPQVHAFDDASLFETNATLPSMIASARAFAGGRGVALSPLSLKPRFNPVATSTRASTMVGAGENKPPQVLEEALGSEPVPSNADARQFTVLGAAWAVSALAALAPCAPQHATLFEATGPRGLMRRSGGAPLLAPLFHALAAANAFAGSEVLPVTRSRPELVSALALRRGGRIRILLANTSCEPQSLELQLDAFGGALRMARVMTLDESSAAGARHEPGFLCGRGGREHALSRGALSLELGAYAVARVDFEAG